MENNYGYSRITNMTKTIQRLILIAIFLLGVACIAYACWKSLRSGGASTLRVLRLLFESLRIGWMAMALVSSSAFLIGLTTIAMIQSPTSAAILSGLLPFETMFVAIAAFLIGWLLGILRYCGSRGIEKLDSLIIRERIMTPYMNLYDALFG